MRNSLSNNGAPRYTAERRGALRILTGRLNSATPHWNPPYFVGLIPNYLIFYASGTPFPDAQIGKAGECETTGQTKGAPKFGYSALGSAVFWRMPENYLIFYAPSVPPFPNAQMEKGKYETTDQSKGHRGTPRNLKWHLNLATPNWNPPYFGLFPPNYVIFFPPNAPFPNTKMGKGNTKLPTKQRGAAERDGTPRKATEPDGAPKFSYSALESAIFWSIFSKLCNIFCTERPPFPNTQMERGAKCETTDQTKGRGGGPRNAAERCGA